MESARPLWDRFAEIALTNRIRKYVGNEVPKALNYAEDIPGCPARKTIGADFDLQTPCEHYIVDWGRRPKLLTGRAIFCLRLINRWLPRMGFYVDYSWKPHRLAHPPKRSKYGWSWDV